MKKIKFWHLGIIFVLTAFIYFYHPLFSGFIPSPTDALVGLYHPFRDLYAPNFPNGIPYKNFLITDPVRQIIPWKELALSMIYSGQMPLWNPYELAGKPLLGNFQSSIFYPLNIILFLKPFYFSWSVFILLQQVLAFFFMFLYLRSLKLENLIAVIGAFIFSFSGFIIAWLEWGTVAHTYIYLPLALYSIHKIFQTKSIKYFLLYTVSLTLSFFAGHLQTFIYIFALSSLYFVMSFITASDKKNILKWFLASNFLFLAISIFQLIPTLQFLFLSARNVDQMVTQPGWFIPLQHLLQFVAPDFFGNPATLNYWGVWNYAEFLGYIGIVPLTFTLATLGVKKREVLFFQIAVLVCLIFATQNPLSEYIYRLNIPFYTSAQPTRLIGIISFSLIMLAVFGMQKVYNSSFKKIYLLAPGVFILFFACVWYSLTQNTLSIEPVNLSVTKRNFILPTMLLTAGAVSYISLLLFSKREKLKNVVLLFLLALAIFDLTRLAIKFTPFSKSEYFYPKSEAIKFLQKDNSKFRIATTDNRILAPNIATFYRLESINGYDPLYLKDYAEYIALNERQKADIDPPYGFNRIITPHNLDTKFINFLNVKYILSLTDIDREGLEKVFQKGETRIYENTNSFPRAFFVQSLEIAQNDKETAQILLESNLRTTAVTTENIEKKSFATGEVTIKEYKENKVILETKNGNEGFLILSDAYYPTWKVKINGYDSKIYKVNLAFRGVIVPKGENEVVFYTELF